MSETQYERRVRVAAEAIRLFTRYDYDESQAEDMAVKVLYAVDTIPEKIR